MYSIKKLFFHTKLIRLSICVILVIFVGAIKCTECYIRRSLDTDKIYNDILICNVDVGGKTKEEAYNLVLKQLKSEQENLTFNVLCDGHNLTFLGRDFDYQYNLEEVIHKAYNCARHGSLFARYIELIKKRNNSAAFEVRANVSAESVERVVNHIIGAFDDYTMEAHVEKFDADSAIMFRYASGRDGYKLNREAVLEQIRNAAENYKSVDIYLEKAQYKNTSTIEDAKEKTKLIGEFKTISTNSNNANHNMRLSMRAVNGTVLKPGDIFSFNETVGDSNDPERGFLPGATIINGDVVMAYGGGVCQAATTIYGAAIRANLTLIERKNHSYKSSYVPYGLDASIDYKTIDLKFRNDLAYPVYICAKMKNEVLECQIYGPQDSTFERVEIKSWAQEKNGSIVAEAEQIFYNKNKIVKKKYLPISVYKRKET